MPKVQDDFVKIRKGVFEHLSKGWITADMLAAYMALLDECVWSTGVWRGSAKRLSNRLGWRLRKTQRVLSKLIEARYVTSRYIADGSNLEYDVLINNYTPPDSKTTVRMRPVKAGLNRVKNDVPPCVKNDADPRQKRRTPASNLTTKYTDLKTTDYISDRADSEKKKNQGHHTPVRQSVAAADEASDSNIKNLSERERLAALHAAAVEAARRRANGE